MNSEQVSKLLIDLYENHFYEFLELWVPIIMILTGGFVLLVEGMFGMKAKYGRYSSPKSLGLQAPIAWLLQECPSFFVPLALIIHRRASLFNNLNTNVIILGYFMIHYFNR